MKKIVTKKLPSYRAIHYRATKLPRYRATKLLSYQATSMKIISVEKATKLPSYRLPSYWATKLLSWATELSYWASELPSYWVTCGMSGVVGQTKLPSYQAAESFELRIFFGGENKATKLPSYQTKDLRFHPYYLPYLKGILWILPAALTWEHLVGGPLCAELSRFLYSPSP